MADDSLKFKIGERVYELSPKDITGRDERDFRKETGYTVASALTAMASGEVLLEVAAALAWLAERKNDKDAKYDDFLDSITYGNLDLDSDEEEAENPPTEGGN